MLRRRSIAARRYRARPAPRLRRPGHAAEGSEKLWSDQRLERRGITIGRAQDRGDERLDAARRGLVADPSKDSSQGCLAAVRAYEPQPLPEFRWVNRRRIHEQRWERWRDRGGRWCR